MARERYIRPPVGGAERRTRPAATGRRGVVAVLVILVSLLIAVLVSLLLASGPEHPGVGATAAITAR